MADLITMRELLERIEKATAADRELDGAIWRQVVGFSPDMLPAVWPDVGRPPSPFPPLTASIDASLALVEKALPGWVWYLTGSSDHGVKYARFSASKDALTDAPWAEGKNLPLAILAALLRALIAQRETA